MTEKIEVAIGDPYATMLAELRETSESSVDDDLTNLLEDAIHNGYQEAD